MTTKRALQSYVEIDMNFPSQREYMLLQVQHTHTPLPPLPLLPLSFDKWHWALGLTQYRT